jgi:hypothetical protein
MRLIRTLLVVGGAGLLLPAPPESPDSAITATPVGPATADLSAFDMLASAGATVADVAGFCARQPAACHTAGVLAHHVEARAKYGVKLLYDWAADSDDARAPTGNVRSTLRLDDLLPEWREPGSASKKG